MLKENLSILIRKKVPVIDRYALHRRRVRSSETYWGNKMLDIRKSTVAVLNQAGIVVSARALSQFDDAFEPGILGDIFELGGKQKYPEARVVVKAYPGNNLEFSASRIVSEQPEEPVRRILVSLEEIISQGSTPSTDLMGYVTLTEFRSQSPQAQLMTAVSVAQ